MNNDAQMFVTVIIIFYNINDGSFYYANAGHHSGQIISSNGIYSPKNYNYIALDIFDNAKLKSGKSKHEVGGIGIQYTDGILEAISPEDEEYGLKRLEERLVKNKPLDDICKKLFENVSEFETDQRFDDITTIAIKRIL